MQKKYAILNLVSIVSIIVWNYYINSVGINGNTVGSLSDQYANLFTPAGYAFSIWGLIFIGLLIHGIHQVKVAYGSNPAEETLMRMGPWLIIANIGNALWLWVWLHELTFISVLVMVGILVSLLTLVVQLGIGLESVPKRVQRWTWAPISLYAGWIAVATIANISAFLAKENWQVLLSETQWTVCLIVTALIVNLSLIVKRSMLVFAGVGAWALAAIAVRHWGENDLLQWTAAVAASLLVLAIGYQLISSRRVQATASS